MARVHLKEALRVESGRALHPRFSPDGRRLAVDVVGAGGTTDIWTKDLDRDTFSRLTTLEGSSRYPVWTPDGKAVVFQNYAAKPAIYWIPADGSSPARQMSDVGAYPWSVSPDGKRLALHMRVGDAPLNVFTAPIEGDAASPRLGKAEAIAPAAMQQADASFSPDGKWLAYTSFVPGTGEVHVRSSSGGGGQWQISSGGGESAVWARRGQELFYSAPEGIMAVPYTVSGGQFVPGKARLWSKQRPASGAAFAWDVAPDGKQILLMHALGDEGSGSQLTILFHFLDEVKRRAGR